MSTHDSEDACCAHLRVEYRTEDFPLSEEDAATINVAHDANSPYPPLRAGATMTRGWWECTFGCGTRFVPSGRSLPSRTCAQCHLNGAGEFAYTDGVGCANPRCVTKRAVTL